MNWKYILIVIIVAATVGGGTWWLSREETLFIEIPKIEKPEKAKSDIDQFRDLCLKFVRKVAENYFDGEITLYPEKLEIRGNWEPCLTLYHQGEIKGEGKGENEILALALEEATLNTIKELNKEALGEARFLVKFLYPPDQFSFIEYNGEGKELIGDLVVIRNLDKEIILEKIEEGKEFLYRMMDEEEKGFHKYYYALKDELEDRLHTVYSASIIYTFLYIYDFENDEEILANIPDWGDFLLSMQNKSEKNESYGAFHYSYYLDTKEKEKNFVVGTSALTIFTLLRLYELTNDSKYLESAKLAGDWLITMQETTDTIKPYLRYSDGRWLYGKKESLLYEGQVLSALSKLYKETQDKKYYDVVGKIAELFADKYEKEKGYVQGEYREKNPISNSWVVMSLMDFYRVNPDERYKNIIFELSEKILENQKNDTSDLLYYGGWGGAYSTSGVGWISEVMGETYRFCKEQNEKDCDKYKDSVIRATRWLLQNTYSEENTFFLKNPERTIGGVFWNQSNKYVRTDSVCHALNGYVRIINDLKAGLLFPIPEEPLEEILNELKNPVR
jgi:rhamnogalacturonyl hydrolase YesR